MPSIASHSVLVIGGSSGIGFSVAKLCIAEKMRVIIASSSQAKVQEATEKLASACPEAQNKPKGYVIDLNSPEVEANLEKLLNNITSNGAEPLDHIIITAGKPNVQPISDANLPYLVQSAQIPIFVSVLVAKLGSRFLREGYAASIIFTSGQVAEKPIPGYSVFSAYAAAQYGLTRNLALDLAPRRVNLVSPGSTETELWGEHREMMRDMVAKKSLLGKPGSPDEVAEAYIYLMKNTDATGSIVSSNAGSVLQ
jgi:NAD(P)-dependent dehydrogenase (short-subunit alcohol dehydrogenase family)